MVDIGRLSFCQATFDKMKDNKELFGLLLDIDLIINVCLKVEHEIILLCH